MKPNPTSVSSTTLTLEAIDIMQRSGIGCLPIVDDDQLVGIVTSYDFLTATASLFKEHLVSAAKPSEKSARICGASAKRLQPVKTRVDEEISVCSFLESASGF
jgi:CBS-domain-containing membrane protein